MRLPGSSIPSTGNYLGDFDLRYYWLVHQS
jgi:hypothetical protein